MEMRFELCRCVHGVIRFMTNQNIVIVHTVRENYRMTTRKFVHVLNVVVVCIGMEIVFGNVQTVIIQKKIKRS